MVEPRLFLYKLVCAASAPPPLLWSKGMARHCDFRGPWRYWLRSTESVQSPELFRRYYRGASGLVWVRLGSQARKGRRCDLDTFVEVALPTIRSPFVLVTGDGDARVPSDLSSHTARALLESPHLVRWYTQNCDDLSQDKLHPLPIGLDFHRLRGSLSPALLAARLRRLRRIRTPVQNAEPRVFNDLAVHRHTALWPEQRRRAYECLHGCQHVDTLDAWIPERDIWQRYAGYPFVLSAPGTGLDCHRTWEAIYLGCIVITPTSPLDVLYADLPVAIVQDWEEAADVDNLRRWQRELSSKTEAGHVWSMLDPRRWVEPMRAALVG